MFRLSSPRPSIIIPLELVLVAGFALFLSASPAAAYIEGYAYPPSIAQGESVSLFVSTDQSTFDVFALEMKDKPEIDEIRVGATLGDVLAMGEKQTPGTLLIVR